MKIAEAAEKERIFIEKLKIKNDAEERKRAIKQKLLEAEAKVHKAREDKMIDERNRVSMLWELEKEKLLLMK